ncbi:uncharacterized protein [Palaemon carinicauda]|uniref:uncharacterized protein n=1 Tax=Palaemon carinicauda TaxID=392227 RepID=UPI0035B5F4CF
MCEPKMFCCCNVRHGSIFIACVILVVCIADIGVALIGLPRNFIFGCRDGDQMIMDQAVCQDIAGGNQVKSSIFLSIRLLTDVLLLSVSSMLIHGLRKCIPCLMIPFRVVHVIAIVSVALSTLIQLIILARARDLANFFLLMVLGPVVVVILTYLYLVVKAAYLETKRSQIQAYREFQDEEGKSSA